MARNTLHCLECGMTVDSSHRYCPKCDNDLRSQTDGSTITVDISHHGEIVRDAQRKLEKSLSEAQQGLASKLRVVVGGGLIREQVLSDLRTFEHRGDIRGFTAEAHNAGAILVTLK